MVERVLKHPIVSFERSTRHDQFQTRKVGWRKRMGWSTLQCCHQLPVCAFDSAERTMGHWMERWWWRWRKRKRRKRKRRRRLHVSPGMRALILQMGVGWAERSCWRGRGGRGTPCRVERTLQWEERRRQLRGERRMELEERAVAVDWRKARLRCCLKWKRWGGHL